jgi:UDP-glucose 4-epimerase
MARILVTGGLGYIGSHTVVELQDAGYEVVIVDDLSNSKIEVLDGITTITKRKPDCHIFNLLDIDALRNLFREKTIDGIIHFAASKAVGESVNKPLKYYQNNLGSLINVLTVMGEFSVGPFIFSSSCTVYGQADSLPIPETAPMKEAVSPYGNTKQISEEIIKDTTAVTDLQSIALRYFNPIGAHESADIGELPIGIPQNLVPFITQTAAGLRKELVVFGDDYPTPDGTAIRDYIHVVDLAQAHVTALQRLLDKRNKHSYEIFNLGTGKGNSVLEVIETFKQVTGQELPYVIKGRREGDITAAYADIRLANEELGWYAKRDLGQALLSAWNWQKSLR